MSLQTIYSRIATSEVFSEVTSWLHQDAPSTAILRGFSGSLPAFLLHRLRQTSDTLIICLLESPDDAAYLFSDLEQLSGESDALLLYPATRRTPFDEEQVIDPSKLTKRADILQQLDGGFKGLIITSAEAVYEKVPLQDDIEGSTLHLKVGETAEPVQLVELLSMEGFQRVEFVEEPGEIALRGGILDVYPFVGDYPLRIEFFGDEIDSIREFDPRSQRSVSRLSQARITPNLESRTDPNQPQTSFFSHLPSDAIVVLFEKETIEERMNTLYAKAEELWNELGDESKSEKSASPDHYFVNGTKTFLLDLREHTQLHFNTISDGLHDASFSIEARSQPSFNSNINLLRRQIAQNHADSTDTYILCDGPGQEGRLTELLADEYERGQVKLFISSLHEGFEVPDLQLAVYTDHQIFNRYHRPTARKKKKRYGGINLRELKNLTPGDFVVHVDFGIGKFDGLQKIEVRGTQQEVVRVAYQGSDVLYVNINALYKLHKYTGKEGHQPRLTKLGSGQWERKKARTKKRVKDIARDLIQLYAKRRSSKGHAFPPDTIWQRELEASFQYEDTPDQAVASEAVKQDMEQPIPMDRLVCGDVGFGKTEVAIRAAFKAAQEAKQVAVLVPTTILAAQHYETFSKRLANFPIQVDVLSRFRSKDQQRETVKKLKAGVVDILIGTHRIASKDIKFNDLGLLIIDEEQRFGVSMKEKLRKLRAEVDTLALTATPIPRTLQFSLMGARDLSIISTPPPNRQPIVTEIHTFDKNLIRDAILYETTRGGQVFFIHNRVQSIEEVSAMIRALVPDIRAQVAHGQMPPSQLERVMQAFIDKKFDVLISTNIVENGVDISNANTIIINNANRFGVSELHQLRGRVGRSDRKAFCYLLVPSIHALTREAKQRLQAIEEFSDLGSGFNIAMRDLDIRGAGNMLGAEQSGFIEEMGYETYLKILDEAVQELRSEEFSDLFDVPPPQPGETTVDVEQDAFIPASYIANHVERLNLYRRISEANTRDHLSGISNELEDRFGPVPQEVENVLLAIQLRLLAAELRLPKITFKNRRLFLEIPGPEQDAYFFDNLFHPLLERLSQLARRYVLKESKSKKLRAIIQDVPNLKEGLMLMEKLVPEPSEVDKNRAVVKK